MNWKADVSVSNTTYLDSYGPHTDVKREVFKKGKVRSEVPQKIKAAPPIDDHETFFQWKEGLHVPFDLLLEPKPIIGTDPYKPLQKLAPIEEQHKDELMKTAPRVYMTPAASLDDIEDLEMRELICNYMYTTDWRNAEREATAGFKKHQIEMVDCRKMGVNDPVSIRGYRIERFTVSK